jgi:cytochrome c-type biogenesis protein
MGLDLPGLAFAFTAGALSVFSPCGYALLPGYVSYYLGSRLSRARAVSGGLACTLGLVTVFSVVGGLSSGLATLIPGLVPLLDLLAGGVLVLMGAATLLQLRLPYLSFPVNPTRRTGLGGFYLFGVVYGLSGVGCSAPIFLSVLVFALSRGLLDAVVAFITYALGMGAPLVLTSLLVAQANELMIRRVSGAAPRIQRAGGAVLVLVGLYLVYYSFVTYWT